jgi:hypothetical protein
MPLEALIVIPTRRLLHKHQHHVPSRAFHRRRWIPRRLRSGQHFPKLNHGNNCASLLSRALPTMRRVSLSVVHKKVCRTHLFPSRLPCDKGGHFAAWDSILPILEFHSWCFFSSHVLRQSPSQFSWGLGRRKGGAIGGEFCDGRTNAVCDPAQGRRDSSFAVPGVRHLGHKSSPTRDMTPSWARRQPLVLLRRECSQCQLGA